MKSIRKIAKGVWQAGVVPLLAAEDGQEQKFVKTMEIEELKMKIADFIEMERRSCSMDYCSPEYVARSLHLPLEAVEACIGLAECQSDRSEGSANS